MQTETGRAVHGSERLRRLGLPLRCSSADSLFDEGEAERCCIEGTDLSMVMPWLKLDERGRGRQIEQLGTLTRSLRRQSALRGH